MSYCRFSSDAFRCDVYAYEDVAGGWTIHVAGRKRLIPDDFEDPTALVMRPYDGFLQYQAAMARLDTFPFEDLTRPSAGQTFHEPTLEAFRDRMLALRAEGLRFPDDVLEEIERELVGLAS